MRNLIALNQLYNSFTKIERKELIKDNYIPNYSDDDLYSLNSLIEIFSEKKDLPKLFENFLFSYHLPRLNKELDLLKAVIKTKTDEKIIVNIELKKSSKEKSKLKKQLRDNSFYFNRISKSNNVKFHLIGYMADTEQFIKYDNDQITDIDKEMVYSLLYDLSTFKIFDIQDVFNVNNILLSPLNDCERFIEKDYILTQQQSDLQKNILDSSKDIIKVTGSAGSGKTLLLYDTVRKLKDEGYKIIVISCHRRASEHGKLAEKIGFTSIGIGDLNKKKDELASFDYIFVDEGQRISKNQIDLILSKLENEKLRKIIFFYDSLQWLKDNERDCSSYLEMIRKEDSDCYKLNGSIRSNYFLTMFIINLFNLNNKNNRIEKLIEAIKNDFLKNDHRIEDNINVYYFNNYEHTRDFMKNCKKVLGSTPIYYTPSKRGVHKGVLVKYTEPIDEFLTHKSINPHNYMGQEFDSVTAAIDSRFSYDVSRGLVMECICNASDPVKMLYQILTRARNELNIVVVNNTQLYKDIMKVKKLTKDEIRKWVVSNR
ncbi:AAA family ATPase [Gemella sanguinis]|uniref:AAA family ATPase n=1 Tax=Gemella sanguinis TaxID=84135 RepID=UPI00352D7999